MSQHGNILSSKDAFDNVKRAIPLKAAQRSSDAFKSVKRRKTIFQVSSQPHLAAATFNQRLEPVTHSMSTVMIQLQPQLIMKRQVFRNDTFGNNTINATQEATSSTV